LEGDWLILLSWYFPNIQTEYRTDNPELDSFKEFLLLNGVKVTSEKSADELFVTVTDAIFSIIFFGIIIFGLYKFIDFRRSTFKVIRNNDTKFSDVAGMEDLKREMLQAVDILKHPKEYAAKGIRPINGILLEGNPETGKHCLQGHWQEKPKSISLPPRPRIFKVQSCP